MNKRVLILGEGFLGKYLFNHLESCGHHVRIISKRDCDYIFYGDLIDFIKEDEIFYGKFDLIINASGYTGKPNVDACEDDRENCWYYNVIAPANIIQACNYCNIPMLHISSGCIYNGYEKVFNESDIPNFGIYNDESSFYSRSKHAAELFLRGSMAYIFRIRIPFCGDDTSKNYFNKILKYDKIINVENSVTCVEDFCHYVERFISNPDHVRHDYGIYNIVNTGYLTARNVVEKLCERGIRNLNHEYIGLSDLKRMTKANRSNCRLSTTILKDGTAMPHVSLSLDRCIDKFIKNYKGENER